jgi:hypothetical protein
MFRNTHRLHRQVAAAIAVVALAAPATASAVTDPPMRSPDATDAGIKAQQAESTYQDLRSGDARDAGQASQSPPSPAVVKSADFDWGDAGIGAGSVLGLLLITLSVMFSVVHRKNRTATT